MTGRLPREWVPDVASHQAGLFTARQARDGGATPDQVARRRRNGAWQVVAGDALALADVARTPWRQAVAAALTWPDAVVCFASAAALHRMPVDPDERVHVIVPNRRPGRGRLVTHELALATEDVCRIGGVRVTTLQRTLADCIGRLPTDQAEHLVTWTSTRGRLDVDALARVVVERRKSWGNARRRQALSDVADGALSAAERRLHRILRRAGVTGWVANAPISEAGRIIARADVLFPEARLVIEVDGYAWHGPDRFQQDRDRQNRLVAAGWTVLRFTWPDLTDRPDAVVRQIRALLTPRSA